MLTIAHPIVSLYDVLSSSLSLGFVLIVSFVFNHKLKPSEIRPKIECPSFCGNDDLRDIRRRYRHHLNDVSMVDSHCAGCKFVAVGAGNDVRTNRDPDSRIWIVFGPERAPPLLYSYDISDMKKC